MNNYCIKICGNISIDICAISILYSSSGTVIGCAFKSIKFLRYEYMIHLN